MTITMIHELWHQMMQINRPGTVRYWSAYAYQFLFHGYDRMECECWALQLNSMVADFLKTHKNVTLEVKEGVCSHCQAHIVTL